MDSSQLLCSISFILLVRPAVSQPLEDKRPTLMEEQEPGTSIRDLLWALLGMRHFQCYSQAGQCQGGGGTFPFCTVISPTPAISGLRVTDLKLYPHECLGGRAVL